MKLMTQSSALALWQDVIKQAERQCHISLKTELESYLVSLLMRYINKPELVKQIIATAFLEAISNRHHERFALQNVGDQCLIYAGLFPKTAEKHLVKISYFVDMGQGAYGKISQCANDIYSLLAAQFVALMDILQSIRCDTLLPLEAYEQWEQVGSQRALRILQSYTQGEPFKK